MRGVKFEKVCLLAALPVHLKMIKGLKNAYPLNIVVGMHSGTWNLLGDHADIKKMKNPLMVEQK